MPILRASSSPPAPLALLLLSTLALATPGCSPSEPDEPSAEAVAEHRREIENWRERRHEELREPDGWLTLVGLYWLEEGESTVGSDPASDVVLPESTPAHLGTLELADGVATFTVAADDAEVEVEVDGEIASADSPTELAPDSSGDATTVRSGTVSFYLIERQDRLGVRVKDSASPVYTGFEGLDYYPVDPAWRIEATYTPYTPPKAVSIPTVLGTPNEDEAPGHVELEAGGETHLLDALDNGDGDIFLVFGDATNGHGSYGGGRFLYASVQGADLTKQAPVVLDFNKAGNPPCVFTPWATCPLPPPQNLLPIAVEAGEKTFGDH